MNIHQFKARMGREPVDDDLERVNCPHTGAIGHWHCGWCPEHDEPRFECGCVYTITRGKKGGEQE